MPPDASGGGPTRRGPPALSFLDPASRSPGAIVFAAGAAGRLLDKFLAAVEAKLERPLARVPREHVSEPNRQQRQAHVGFHAQRQPGRVWAGIALPVVRMTVVHLSQLVGLACGIDPGDLRLNQLMVSPQKALSGV